MSVDVHVTDTEVDITLTGWDALWAFRRRLVLPLADVVAARVVSRADAATRRGLRWGGTGWPGAVAAGNFWVKGNRQERAFWSVYSADEVLEIETRLPRPRYVVLQHGDRNDLAWIIGERVT